MRIAAFDVVTDRDHLPQPHRPLAADRQAPSQVGALRIEARSGRREESVLLERHPQVQYRFANERLFGLLQLAITVERAAKFLAVHALEFRVGFQPADDLERQC